MLAWHWVILNNKLFWHASWKNVWWQTDMHTQIGIQIFLYTRSTYINNNRKTDTFWIEYRTKIEYKLEDRQKIVPILNIVQYYAADSQTMVNIRMLAIVLESVPISQTNMCHFSFEMCTHLGSFLIRLSKHESKGFFKNKNVF